MVYDSKTVETKIYSQTTPFEKKLYKALKSSKSSGFSFSNAHLCNLETFFGSPAYRSKRMYRNQTSVLVFPKFSIIISKHCLSESGSLVN